jgi:hypothetical protein
MPGLKKKIIGVETADRRKAFTQDVAITKLYKTQRWRKYRERFLMENLRMCRVQEVWQV